jgi:hypothetical protein
VWYLHLQIDHTQELRTLEKRTPEHSMVAKLSTIRRKIRTGQKMGFSERARAVNKGLLPSAKKKSKKSKKSN